MYCIFWATLHPVDGEVRANCLLKDDLNDAVKMCEYIRSQPGTRFVTMAVENPNMVGKMGVSDVDENYDWVKRRDAISSRKSGIS